MLLEDHTAASVVKAIDHLERRFERLFYTLFMSITIDNGCEFEAERWINNYPRRLLGWKSATDLFNEELKVV